MNAAWLKSSKLVVRYVWGFVVLWAIWTFILLLLSSCAFGGNQNPLPAAIHPDASTPANLPEFNGGIIADCVIDGKPYNIVPDDVATEIEKWQGSRTGFRRVLYGGNHLWAIDKGVVYKFDTSP